jgi:hypothetical protein
MKTKRRGRKERKRKVKGSRKIKTEGGNSSNRTKKEFATKNNKGPRKDWKKFNR